VQLLAPYHLDHSFGYGKAHGYVTYREPSKAAEIVANTIKGAVEPYVRRSTTRSVKGDRAADRRARAERRRRSDARCRGRQRRSDQAHRRHV
jgi:hypothetical protein